MERRDLLAAAASSAAASQWQQVGLRPHHGIAVPLFSLHTATSCGIGEYPDLVPLIRWCQPLGFDTIQLLPLNDTGGDTSPYNSISAFALNPLHLGLAALPYVESDGELAAELAAMPRGRGSLRVDYAAVRHHKGAFLRRYLEKYRERLVASDNYQQFLAGAPWLRGYGLYKILKARYNQQSWEQWLEEWRSPSPESLDVLSCTEAAALQDEALIQYLCEHQLHKAHEVAAACGVALMGDIPILIGRVSALLWLNRDLFLLSYASGAPPDLYAEEGQYWGSPIYNWEVMARCHYRWWVERLTAAARYYQIYRIDHVVGLFRIWSIPLGLKSHEGHFIPENPAIWQEHGSTILEMMLRCCPMLPIGEDLGTVPPETRVTLTALGICGTKVTRWERLWEGDGSFIDGKDYPPLSLTTLSTHDSEPLALWWRDVPAEAKLYAQHLGWDYQPTLCPLQHEALLRISHATASLFHINLLQEYLVPFAELSWPSLEEQRINKPGIVSDANWSVRLRPSLEEMTSHEGLTRLMRGMIAQDR